MPEPSALAHAARIGGHLIAARSLARAMGGLGWMAQSGQRTWTMLSALFRPTPPPLPAEDMATLPDEPRARFLALQEAVGWSNADVTERRKAIRASFITHFVAATLLLLWAVLAPGLGYAPGLTAILPWAIFMVVLARMVQRSQDHYHLRHRRLVPFREWIGRSENVFMPLFEDAPPARAIVKGIGLVLLGVLMTPLAAWADPPSAIQILSTDLPATDLSLQWVQRIFPSFFPASGVSLAQDATAQLVSMVNTILLTLGAGYLLYEVVSGMVSAAHSGRVFSERYHGPWVPVRVVVGVGSVFPVAGYCMAQLLVINISLFGYKLANEAWKGHVQLAMAIAPVSGPSLPADGRWGIAPGGGSVSVPPDLVAQLPTLQGLISSELCYHAARWGSRLAGETQNPPAQPRQVGSTALRNGRPQYSLPPSGGVDVAGGKTWDYGQVCGSITWTIRPVPATTTAGPSASSVDILGSGFGNAAPVTITRESRIVEREQALRDFDIARATAFSRLVEAVRQDQAMHYVAAVASPGFLPTGDMPDLNSTMQRILTAYGTFKSSLITASTTLSATLNRETRAGAMDRVNALGWAAAGAFQPALASMNRTVVERVVELPTIQGFNAGALASGREMQAIFERGQRQLSEAIYAALPAQILTGSSGSSMSEIDTIRELRTNPETAVSTWMARLSRRIFQSMEGMARLDATDPLTSIRNHGQAMEAAMLGGWATWTLMNTAVGGVSGGAEGVNSSLLGLFGAGVPSLALARAMEATLRAASTFVNSFFWWGLALSALYSTVLPMLGYMFWMFAVAGQITYMIEAVVGAAFWAFAHVKSDNGHEFVGQAQRHGYAIAFNSVFRPLLMVIGLALGHVVFAVTAMFVNSTFGLAVDSAFSGEAFYGSRVISPVGLLVLMAMLFYIHYQLAVRSYSLITELPDRVARWSGASGENLGEAGHFEDSNRTIVGGVMNRTSAFGQSAAAAGKAGKDGGQDAEHRGRRQGGGAGGSGGTDTNAIRPVTNGGTPTNQGGDRG